MSVLSKYKFPRTFWIANAMELFERWAYYGMFTVLSIYLTDPESQGGLGFSNAQKGSLMGIITMLIYILPVLAGAIADKLGFRKVLIAAFATLASGYYFMGQFNTYGLVFIMFLIVGIGAALFKPIIIATVSKTASKGQETIAFGIFYMIVNVGGFIGPFVASKLRVISWDLVFIMSAAVIALNFLLLIYYKEPGRDKDKNKEPFKDTILQIFRNMGVALSDFKFLLFLIIMIGFWVMYMQLFFTAPVFITQWIDTTGIYNTHPFIAWAIGSEDNGVGMVKAEMMINLAAFSIILFQVIVSTLVSKIKPVVSMVLGALVIVVGMSQFGLHTTGWFIVLGIVIIAFGEMASSPRIQEYISSIAPKEKIALYMGVSYIPLAAGNYIGGLLSGGMYDNMSDKYNLLKKELVNRGYASIEKLQDMDGGILFKDAMDYLNMNEAQLNNLLYTTYQPGNIWYIYTGIGAATAVLLFVYNKFILKTK